MAEIDFESLGKSLGAQGVDLLKGLLSGAKEDLQAYGQEIGKDLIRAVKEDRPELEAELKEQLKLIAEIHRIRLNETTWEFVGSVFTSLAKAARTALFAGGISL